MQFDITIHGKGGHGSRPDLSFNPIEMFPSVYAALPDSVVITRVEGGTSTNIIPNDLRFTGSCTEEDFAQLKHILDSLCGAYHCTLEFC